MTTSRTDTFAGRKVLCYHPPYQNKENSLNQLIDLCGNLRLVVKRQTFKEPNTILCNREMKLSRLPRSEHAQNIQMVFRNVRLRQRLVFMNWTRQVFMTQARHKKKLTALMELELVRSTTVATLATFVSTAKGNSPSHQHTLPACEDLLARSLYIALATTPDIPAIRQHQSPNFPTLESRYTTRDQFPSKHTVSCVFSFLSCCNRCKLNKHWLFNLNLKPIIKPFNFDLYFLFHQFNPKKTAASGICTL